MATFPERGTERTEIACGLRIIGYRCTANIAFAVEADRVMVLGVFSGGQNITVDFIEDRLK
ncbi:hypothetical protein [Jiella endophytica]|uniref:hypothetical protein n=1 Tax=Jiella endophytica TaxID=2558362 RepID=UPI001FDED616|nr:hypothetical protein [Jiella endophytica]